MVGAPPATSAGCRTEAPVCCTMAGGPPGPRGWGVEGSAPRHFHTSKAVSLVLGLQFMPQQGDS